LSFAKTVTAAIEIVTFFYTRKLIIFILLMVNTKKEMRKQCW
jgi:hypothetical protein